MQFSLQPRDSLEVDSDRPLHDARVHAATADGIYYVSQLTERGAQQTSVSRCGGLEARVVERVERLQTNLEIEVLAKPRDIRPFNYAQILVENVGSIPPVKRRVPKLPCSREVKARCCLPRLAEYRPAASGGNVNQSRVRVNKEDAIGRFEDTKLALKLTHRHVPEHGAFRHVGCAETAPVREPSRRYRERGARTPARESLQVPAPNKRVDEAVRLPQQPLAFANREGVNNRT